MTWQPQVNTFGGVVYVTTDNEDVEIPTVTDTADRVAMRLGEAVFMEDMPEGYVLNDTDWSVIRDFAAALSSHGLREAVETLETISNWHDKMNLPWQEIIKGKNIAKAALAALLGEGETLKAEEQAG